MSIKDRVKAKAALAAIAAREGVSLAEVEREIRAAIDAAWDNPEGRQEQERLFPGGKPTPAQFVAVVASQLRERE